MVQIDEIPPKPTKQMEFIAAAIDKNAIRFSIIDGRISALCSPPKEEEPSWALNVKRAILEHFQRGKILTINSEEKVACDYLVFISELFF